MFYRSHFCRCVPHNLFCWVSFIVVIFAVGLPPYTFFPKRVTYNLFCWVSFIVVIFAVGLSSYTFFPKK
jgi:uncharacterized membrane protein